MKNKTEKALRKALLLEGKMEFALYQWELEENITIWTDGMKADKDEFVFAITEKDGDVAMLLITKQEQLYVNEDARKLLKKVWPETYNDNIEQLMPVMVKMLDRGVLFVNGIKYSNSPTPSRVLNP